MPQTSIQGLIDQIEQVAREYHLKNLGQWKDDASR